MANEIVKMNQAQLVEQLLDIAAESGDVGEYFGTVLVITGHSGVGKTYATEEIAKTVKGYDTVEVLNLDAFGAQIEGKWIIDLKLVRTWIKDQLEDADGATLLIIEGISNNMDQVYSVITDSLADEILYVVLSPDFDLFRKNQELKAKEGAEKGNPESWIAHWTKLSKQTDKQLSDWFSKENSFFLSKVVGARKAILTMPYAVDKHSGHAWHPKKELKNMDRYSKLKKDDSVKGQE